MFYSIWPTQMIYYLFRKLIILNKLLIIFYFSFIEQ